MTLSAHWLIGSGTARVVSCSMQSMADLGLPDPLSEVLAIAIGANYRAFCLNYGDRE